jgi:hypothetical protein
MGRNRPVSTNRQDAEQNHAKDDYDVGTGISLIHGGQKKKKKKKKKKKLLHLEIQI